MHTMFCCVHVLLNWTLAWRPSDCNWDLANVTDCPTRSGTCTGGPWAPVTRVTVAPLLTVVPLAGLVRRTGVVGVDVWVLSDCTLVLRPSCGRVRSALLTFWPDTSGMTRVVLGPSPMCHQPTELPRKMSTTAS